ncbi:unnamed protein product [Linum tenue]|uniref:Ribosomal protein eL8/eL30/eS12/Gadd45 domain-containing protein n=1 Tax=Linum tenue TaxID=586396 RepID=A0AAV0KUP0_9ROSI|nr:unnamed protein product [Linum tenue]
MMRNKKKAGVLKPTDSACIPHDQRTIEGESLAVFLTSIRRGIESAKKEFEGNSLPQKFWFKQQFAIGVNEVTRVLERMSPAETVPSAFPGSQNPKAPCVQLQAVLVASDCNPKWLTKHLPSLALSRKVPLIFIKCDKKGGGSLRLGELVNLKTAIAVGVRAKGNAVNQCMEPILPSSRSNGISNKA